MGRDWRAASKARRVLVAWDEGRREGGREGGRVRGRREGGREGRRGAGSEAYLLHVHECGEVVQPNAGHAGKVDQGAVRN
jgi:hypothetical protein